MLFHIIHGGEVYTPKPAGTPTLLLADSKIAHMGALEADKLLALGLECDTIDARGCIVIPGFIDPHAHIIGAGGEEGFASRMPEIFWSQIVLAGVTTIVGLLGTDTSTRNLSCLHAKVAQLTDEGLTALMYTGGFELPPRTMTGSVMDDIVTIDKIIGTGEVAISDYRWVDPQLDALAHVVTETMVAGKIAGKAGVTHFHTGEGKRRLGLLHELLDNYDVRPECLYPTHVNRNEELLEDAIRLAKRGAFVDMDTIDENTSKWLRFYHEHEGPLDRLTASSDAHTPSGSNRKLYEQFVACVQETDLGLSQVLPIFTSNTAAALKLKRKGSLAVDNDADVVILDKDTLEIRHLFTMGRHVIADGELVVQSRQEKQLASGGE
jgi:beta-aspartyl-dipeptidase (metallo-type)